MERDSCSIDEWLAGSGSAICAVGDTGFVVFLSPEEIDRLDEYHEQDPYSVQERLESQFHQRRIRTTLISLESAVSTRGGSARILDIGCGEGHITSLIKEAYGTAAIVGLDASLGAISSAKAKYPEIEFMVADAYQVPFPNDYFDAIVLNNIYEHVPDPMRLLAEVLRLLRSGGEVVVSTPSRYRTSNLVRVLQGKPVRMMSPQHVTEYTVGQVLEQLKWSGLTDIQIVPTGESGGGFRARVGRTLNQALRLVGSHHSVESTVFFLGRKI